MDNKRTLVTIVDSENCNSTRLWLLTDDQIELLKRLAKDDLLAYSLTYELGLTVETV